MLRFLTAAALVNHRAVIVGSLPEAGLSTLAWRPQSLPEESTHSQSPVPEALERT
jgi:hypothetical protein